MWRWASNRQLRSTGAIQLFFVLTSPYPSLSACHEILEGRCPSSAACMGPMMGCLLPPRAAPVGPVRHCSQRRGQKGREWGQGSSLNTQGLGFSLTARPGALASDSKVRPEGSPCRQERISAISDNSKGFGRISLISQSFQQASSLPGLAG